MSEFKALGKSTRAPSKELETFAVSAPVKRVKLVGLECTSLCPVTGQPDFWVVDIEFEPYGKALESKSLKQYLWTFREDGVFCEALSARICLDVMTVLGANLVRVTTKQTPRGGVAIESTSELTRGDILE